MALLSHSSIMSKTERDRKGNHTGSYRNHVLYFVSGNTWSASENKPLSNTCEQRGPVCTPGANRPLLALALAGGALHERGAVSQWQHTGTGEV